MERFFEGSPGGGQPTWSDLAHVVAKYKMLILCVLLATVLGAYGALQCLTEVYEVKASVLVKLGRENAEVPATVERGGVFTTGVRKEEINSEIEMLSSRYLIEVTVDKIGPQAFQSETPQPQTWLQTIRFYLKKPVRFAKDQLQTFLILVNLKKELTEREKIVLGIMSALKVEREKDSDVIGVSLRMPDPDLALRVLDVLLQLYYDYRVRVRGGNVAVRQFFDAQTEAYKQKLQDVVDAREKIRARWNLSAVVEQRSFLLRRLHDLETQIDANETEKVQLREQQKIMQARRKGLADEVRSSQTVTPNPTAQSIKERMNTLQLERTKLLSRYTPESPPIKHVDSELEMLRGLLKQEDPTLLGSVTSERNPFKYSLLQNLEQTEIKLAGLEASTQQLRVQAQGVDRQLKALNTGNDQLEYVERERGMAEQEYLTYTKRREESHIAEELDRRRIANVAILNPPARPIEPVYPRKMLIMLVSLPIGLLLGVIPALLLEYTNDVIRTQHDLASLGDLAYLGTFHQRLSRP